MGLTSVYGADHRIVGCRVYSHHEEHKLFAGSAGIAVGCVAVNPLYEQRGVRTRQILVLRKKWQRHLHLVLLVDILCNRDQTARFIDHIMLHFRTVHLHALCTEHKVHQRCVIAVK